MACLLHRHRGSLGRKKNSTLQNACSPYPPPPLSPLIHLTCSVPSPRRHHTQVRLWSWQKEIAFPSAPGHCGCGPHTAQPPSVQSPCCCHCRQERIPPSPTGPYTANHSFRFPRPYVTRTLKTKARMASQQSPAMLSSGHSVGHGSSAGPSFRSGSGL